MELGFAPVVWRASASCLSSEAKQEAETRQTTGDKTNLQVSTSRSQSCPSPCISSATPGPNSNGGYRVDVSGDSAIITEVCMTVFEDGSDQSLSTSV